MSIQTLQTGNKIKAEQGFTLVELLLVIALLVFSVGITGDIIITLTRSYSKSQVQTEIEQNSNFVSLKLEKELRNAQSVVTTSTTPTTLAFVDNSGLNIVCYSLIGSALARASVPISNGTCPAANTFQLLTSSDVSGGVTVGCGSATQCFAVSQTTGGPFVVRLHLEFTQAYSGSRKELTGGTSYDNVIVVRGSY